MPKNVKDDKSILRKPKSSQFTFFSRNFRHIFGNVTHKIPNFSFIITLKKIFICQKLRENKLDLYLRDICRQETGFRTTYTHLNSTIRLKNSRV